MENPIQKNYTIGRGRIYFDKFLPGKMSGQGERYLGNTPELNTSADVESLPHYNSDSQIREKDLSIVLQVDRSGTFTTDQISVENLALFFFGDVNALTQVGATDEEFKIKKALPGMTYQIGMTDDNPAGVSQLTEVTATAGVGGTLEIGKDIFVDLEAGRLTVAEGQAIDNEGAEVTVTFSSHDVVRERVMSGNTPIEGSLRFVADNPVGKNYDHYWPRVSISPNGDYALKDDEWQTIPFTFEIMTKPGTKQHYVFDRGVVALAEDDNG